MKITATKEFTWDCAHMLSGHNGLCQNLHGHTYKLEVTVAGEQQALQTAGPADGMVVDFKDLKDVVKAGIVDPLDHATIVFRDTRDPFEEDLFAILLKHNKKVVPLAYRPTAENMVRDFFRLMQLELVNIMAPYKVVRMRLYETPTSYAEISE